MRKTRSVTNRGGGKSIVRESWKDVFYRFIEPYRSPKFKKGDVLINKLGTDFETESERIRVDAVSRDGEKRRFYVVMPVDADCHELPEDKRYVGTPNGSVLAWMIEKNYRKEALGGKEV